MSSNTKSEYDFRATLRFREAPTQSGPNSIQELDSVLGEDYKVLEKDAQGQYYSIYIGVSSTKIGINRERPEELETVLRESGIDIVDVIPDR